MIENCEMEKGREYKKNIIDMGKVEKCLKELSLFKDNEVNVIYLSNDGNGFKKEFCQYCQSLKEKTKGYNLKFLGNSLFGDINYVPEIGYYRSIQLVHSTNQTLLKNASSGGMMTQIASALLRKSEVNGVITTRFVYDNNHVRTETFIATNEEELIKGQGSKYCPTSTLSIIKELDPQKKYLLIGTPCQIAGYRMFANLQPNVKEMIPYTMANFCGGYRDFKELDFFVSKIAHTKKIIII